MECKAELLNQWQTVINTAMHFNGLLLSTRTLLASVMLAVVGAAAVSITHFKAKEGFVGKLHIGVWIIIGGFALLLCVFGLDYFYYFQLLLGSVDVAKEIEMRCTNLVHLTVVLSDRVSVVRAHEVIFIFYGAIAAALIVTGIIILRISLKPVRRSRA